MVDLPSSLQITKETYLTQFRNDVINVSKGRLFDFSDSSVLRIIGESQALSIERIALAQSEILPYISSYLLESLGFTRSSGTYAVCTVRFLLSGIFTRDFIIPRGYRFSLGDNRVFETIADLIIPANIDTSNPINYPYCRVDAVAIEIGNSSNQPAQKASILQPIQELDSLWIDEPSKGGNSEESPQDFLNRVSLIIGKFLESEISLVQPLEFELATQAILGSNSVAIAIPDVSSDGATVSIASMNVFTVNPDGSQLTSAQIRQLTESLGNRAPLVSGRLYFSNLTIPKINIYVTVTIAPTDDNQVIATNINRELRDAFSIQKTKSMRSLELYEAIYIVRKNGGLTPVLRWAYVGDIAQARDLPLPKVSSASDETSPVKIELIKIIVEPSGYEQNFTNL